ncbi:hypothetical protein GCM10029978_067150 [Actinoallomurus acanthiterrae]
MSETLVLSLPETLLAEFVVAGPQRLPPAVYDPPADAREATRLRLWRPDIQLRRTGTMPMRRLLHDAVCPDCPNGLATETRRRIERSEHFIHVSCTGTAAWPPLHVPQAALSAAAHAIATGGVVLDAATARPLHQVWQQPSSHADPFAIGRWISVTARSAGANWAIRTAGLSRCGLPELAACGIPTDLLNAWARILNGVAHRLLLDQWEDLADNHDRAFREAPAVITVTVADIETAMSLSDMGPPAAANVGLQLDPETARHPTLLQVLPPSLIGTGTDQDIVEAIGWRRAVAARLTPYVLL